MSTSRPTLTSIANTGGSNVDIFVTFRGGVIGIIPYQFSVWTTPTDTSDPLTTGTEYPATYLGDNKAEGVVPGVKGNTYYIWGATKQGSGSAWLFNSSPALTVIVTDYPSTPGDMTFVSETPVAGTNTIVVVTQSDVTNQVGATPITQGGLFTLNDVYPPEGGTSGSTVSAGGNLWNTTFTIQQGQTYYFWSSSTNAIDTSYSFIPLQYNSASDVPVNAPSVPTLLSALPDGVNVSVSVQFDTAGQTGQPAPTYAIFVGTTTDPYGAGVLKPVYPISGTLYGSQPFTLSANTNYYIFSRAFNDTSRASSAYFLFNSASQGAPTAPSEPLVSGVPTTTSISVTFSTASVTGVAPISYTCFGATDISGPFDIPTSVTNIGTNYTAVADRLLPNTNYLFQAYATNSAGSATSTISPFIKTANNGPNKPPTVPVVHINPTPYSIIMAFNIAGVTGEVGFPVTFTCAYSTDATGPFNTLATLSGSSPQLIATAAGLLPNTTYYFVSRAISNGYTLESAVSDAVTTAIVSNNPNDFAYYPPRPWAYPNPVIVNGISQPFRQT